MTFPQPVFSPVVADAGVTVVDLGVNEENATSFTLNPTNLGAQVGDVMVVCAAWEDENAITPPSGWTEQVDENSAETTQRVSIHTIVFSGSVPGDQTWSYGGDPFVSYGWAIIRGVNGVESAFHDEGDTSGSLGTDSFSVSLTGSRVAAVVGAMVATPFNIEGEDAVLSGVDQEVNSGTGHVAGLYAMMGFTESSTTVEYTTSEFVLSFVGNYIVYLE